LVFFGLGGSIFGFGDIDNSGALRIDAWADGGVNDICPNQY